MATSGRFSPNKVRKRLLDDTWVFPNSGMVLMRPTSIVSTGTGASATIGTNGSVTFSSCETLSLNGVFTSGFDNYMVVIRCVSTAAGILYGRLRTSGADSTSSNYTRQYFYAGSTLYLADRETSQTYLRVGSTNNLQRSGSTIYLFGPYLSQPTATRNVGVYPDGDAAILDAACTHSLSTSYDGLTLAPQGANFTGLVSVYGLGG